MPDESHNAERAGKFQLSGGTYFCCFVELLALSGVILPVQIYR